ncbi:hypothetical protein [Hymenobacter cellulosivorans]|uniref:Entericidin n=1 Tax=Hymenobacter cellulosivorans TaxID=2932249 RepID=A0ABY4FD08_9BACT|nr:hypothetical protein [Hymenobacter cellulosivorans]UOQ54305.1 hypothetical protein MUN80_05985 [Hymenobacter cellulosivorans]
MKIRFFSLLALGAVLSFSSCNNAEKRTDGTAGEAVSDMDKAADEGGVQADATVIDNDAGATVNADGDSAAAATPPAE